MTPIVYYRTTPEIDALHDRNFIELKMLLPKSLKCFDTFIFTI